MTKRVKRTRERKYLNTWSDSFRVRKFNEIASFLVGHKALIDLRGQGPAYQLASRREKWLNERRLPIVAIPHNLFLWSRDCLGYKTLIKACTHLSLAMKQYQQFRSGYEQTRHCLAPSIYLNSRNELSIEAASRKGNILYRLSNFPSQLLLARLRWAKTKCWCGRLSTISGDTWS